MRVVLAADHAGLVIRDALAEVIRAAGHEPVILGAELNAPEDDYPVFARSAGDDPVDLEIPGKPFGFSQLKQAQAAGDYLALKDRGLRVARVALEELLDLGR